MDNQTTTNPSPNTDESLPKTEPEITSPPSGANVETPPTSPTTEVVETNPSPPQPETKNPPVSELSFDSPSDQAPISPESENIPAPEPEVLPTSETATPSKDTMLPENESSNSDETSSAIKNPGSIANDQSSNPTSETISETKTPPPPMPKSLINDSSDTPPSPDAPSNQATAPKTFTIKGLITKTWQSLKLNFGKLIILYILQILPIAIIAAGIAVAVVSIIGGSIGELSSFSEADFLAFLQSISLSQAGIAIGVSLVITFIGGLISTAFTLAQISLIGNQDSTSLSFHIKRGFTSLLPYIGASIVMGFLAVGSLGLLFIPYIIIAIYLSLFQFQIIIDNKSAIASLKGSATIIKHRFGHLLKRILILFAIHLVFSSIIPAILNSLGEPMELVAGLYSFIVGIGLSLFSIIYVVELYKELRDTTNWEKPASITWMWIVAIIGWLIIGVGSYFLATQALPQLKESFGSALTEIVETTDESNEINSQLETNEPIMFPENEASESQTLPESATTLVSPPPILDEVLPTPALDNL